MGADTGSKPKQSKAKPNHYPGGRNACTDNTQTKNQKYGYVERERERKSHPIPSSQTPDSW